jgi:ribonuclease HII
MRAAEHQYPGYSFARHKGYGTRLHQLAIRQLGLCEIHRKSFSLAI